VTFSAGDRIRHECTGDDGLPLVRYGFVGGVAGSDGPVVVMLDGELGGDVVNLAEVQPVTVTTVELRLAGGDLVDEPELRKGLLALWLGEADSAGLDIDEVQPLGEGRCEHPGSWCLAALTAGGRQYLLRAEHVGDEHVRLRAEAAL
jgi:hypothetical protein